MYWTITIATTAALALGIAGAFADPRRREAVTRDSWCSPRASRDRVALDPTRHAWDLADEIRYFLARLAATTCWCANRRHCGYKMRI